ANNLQLALPPSRLGRTWGGRFSFEETLQRAPVSGRGNNSRSLSVRQPMLPHELVASVSARATSAPDHQEANLGPTGTSPTASPRTPQRRPARDFHARKVPGRAFRSPATRGPREACFAGWEGRGSTRRSRGRGSSSGLLVGGSVAIKGVPAP